MTTNHKTPALLLRRIKEINQALGFIDRLDLDDLVIKYNVDRYVKDFRTVDMIKIAMLYFYSKERYLKHFLEALYANKACCALFHVPHTSVQHVYKALKKRCWWFFYEAFHQVVAKLQGREPLVDKLFRNREVRIIDSTFVEVAMTRLFFARFGYCSTEKRYKEGMKLHVLLNYSQDLVEDFVETPASVHDSRVADTLLRSVSECVLLMDKGYHKLERYQALDRRGVTFIIPFKQRSSYDMLEERELDFDGAAVTCKIVRLSNGLKVQLTSVEGFELICNDLSLSWYEIHALYTMRWEIENLFKRLKSGWRIDQPLFRNHNSIMSFICMTLIAYLLLERLSAELHEEILPVRLRLGRRIETCLECAA